MNTFQILMFAMTLIFAYQIYRHIQNLDDVVPQNSDIKGSFPQPSASALVDKADIAYEKGDIRDAKMYLEEAVALEPQNPEILNKLAFVTAKSGDRLNAIELYERSLELESDP